MDLNQIFINHLIIMNSEDKIDINKFLNLKNKIIFLRTQPYKEIFLISHSHSIILTLRSPESSLFFISRMKIIMELEYKTDINKCLKLKIKTYFLRTYLHKEIFFTCLSYPIIPAFRSPGPCLFTRIRTLMVKIIMELMLSS